MFVLLNKKRFIIIIIVFILLLIAGGGGWYFGLGFIQEQIVKTPSYFSKNSFVVQNLQQQELKNLSNIPVLRNLSTTITPTSLQVQDRLQKSGKVLIYQGDPTDTTGRSMLTKTNNSSVVVGLGGEIMDFEINPATISANVLDEITKSFKDIVLVKPHTIMHDVWRETGVFRSWVEIPNSSDLYLRLTDPQRKQDFVVRINFQTGSCYPANESTLSYLAVQALNDREFVKLGSVTSWSKKDLAQIIKPGDILKMYNLTLAPSLINSLARMSMRDTLGIVCTNSLIVQRFDGKSQLEKELQRPIPDSQP